MAEKYDSHQQRDIGELYDSGLGVKKDGKKAAEWSRKAADKGHLVAMYLMGTLYDDGRRGVDKDGKKAAEWYKKAADKGHLGAMHSLAVMYETGKGVAKDPAEAMKWKKKWLAAVREILCKQMELEDKD